MSMTFATNVAIDSSHNLNLQGMPVYYGTCATEAATTAKVVTCTNFVLAKGALLFVKFTYANTGAVASLTMNVNSTGAKPVKEIYNGSIANLTAAGNIQANATLLFSYDGTNWVLMNATGMPIEETKVLVVDTGAVSSLPTTITNSNITSDMVAINVYVEVPSKLNSELTITTANGSATISGTLNGSTNITLYLMRSR